MKVFALFALVLVPQAILAGHHNHMATNIGRAVARNTGNIAEELTAAGASTLVDLVVKAGLADTVSTGGPFTVFAPTNAAFAKLPKSILDALAEDVELLKKVLLYHVVSGKVMSTDLSNDLVANSVEGTSLRINIYRTCKFHCNFYNDIVTVNGKRVVKADVEANNGVIHMVDEVIYPFADSSIPEVLTKDGRFGTLLTAVQAAGLVDTLSSAGPFTVFAPTDDAFAKVPSDVLNGLLGDPEALKAVLLRHVVPKTLFAKGISWQVLDSAGGEMIKTYVYKNGLVKVASAMGNYGRVVDADLIASNGVVHAIDTVI